MSEAEIFLGSDSNAAEPRPHHSSTAPFVIRNIAL